MTDPSRSPLGKTVCYVGGCGRLGLSMAVWCAQKGYRVFCADVNAQAVAKVQAGRSPVSEPGLSERVGAWSGKRLFATTDVAMAVAESDVSCVIVPTPSQPDGSFSLEHVLSACDDLASALAHKTSYCLVIVVSTVMPGSTGGPIRHRLEGSGKQAGRDFGLVYVPAYVRQGCILPDFANPDLVLIGELDERSGDAVQDFYASVVENSPRFYRMSPVSAEIAKLGLNVALVMKMALAGQIAWLCQRHPGADAAEVLAAIGGDSRIGPACLKVGTWPGGPCLPRDTAALAAAFGEDADLASLAEAVRRYNSDQAWVLADLVRDQIEGPVGILGLAYKPGTDILENSQGLELAWILKRLGREVRQFDPRALHLSDSLEYIRATCPVLVLMTPWPELKALEEMDLSGKTIIDMWGFFDEALLNCGRYIRFGRGDG